MGKNVITNFPITVYGKMEKFSDTISRGRCRVFYKGRNRNGTYITDEFAEKHIPGAINIPNAIITIIITVVSTFFISAGTEA